MALAADFDRALPLPLGLDIGAIRRAVDYIEKELADFVELYLDQANVFSAVVGILGTKALSQYSQFEKNRHPDIAAQRFPDPCRRGRIGKLRPNDCLESKGSKRPFAIQSHFDHAGCSILTRPCRRQPTGNPPRRTRRRLSCDSGTRRRRRSPCRRRFRIRRHGRAPARSTAS